MKKITLKEPFNIDSKRTPSAGLQEIWSFTEHQQTYYGVFLCITDRYLFCITKEESTASLIFSKTPKSESAFYQTCTEAGIQTIHETRNRFVVPCFLGKTIVFGNVNQFSTLEEITTSHKVFSSGSKYVTFFENEAQINMIVGVINNSVIVWNSGDYSCGINNERALSSHHEEWRSEEALLQWRLFLTKGDSQEIILTLPFVVVTLHFSKNDDKVILYLLVQKEIKYNVVFEGVYSLEKHFFKKNSVTLPDFEFIQKDLFSVLCLFLKNY